MEISERCQKFYEAGKAMRKSVPRSSHGKWQVLTERTSGNELIKSQEVYRVKELLPIRYERMAVSPFTFFRGSAAIMAEDLAQTPTIGVYVQACGDAHIGNFGAFASPERHLVFDINDFDETTIAPWEWDVKRLVASVAICGRDRQFDQELTDYAVAECMKAYRRAISDFANKGNLEVWNAHIDVTEKLKEIEERISKEEKSALIGKIKNATQRNSVGAVKKFTEVAGGQLRIISKPPLIAPLHECFEGVSAEQIQTILFEILHSYKESLQKERKHLLDQYAYVDCARKVVGVGSVGNRAWIVVMEGKDPQDPLVLQIKQAEKSVLEDYVGLEQCKNHGQRVVEGQRLMQSSSDIFLGWARGRSVEGETHDFYVRQLWDWKTSVDLDEINGMGLVELAKLCGWTLARAHARSGNRFMLAGYLGKSDHIDKAMVRFANSYADQNEADYEAFLAYNGFH